MKVPSDLQHKDQIEKKQAVRGITSVWKPKKYQQINSNKQINRIHSYSHAKLFFLCRTTLMGSCRRRGRCPGLSTTTSRLPGQSSSWTSWRRSWVSISTGTSPHRREPCPGPSLKWWRNTCTGKWRTQTVIHVDVAALFQIQHNT